MPVLRKNTAVRALVLALQLAFTYASIPHFHSMVSAGDPGFITASFHVMESGHSYAGCAACVLSGSWIAEETSRFRLSDDLPCLGIAASSGNRLITIRTTLSTHLRGPPRV